MKKTILVVDDNRMMREFMSNLLKGQGHQVFLAENGFEALNSLTSTNPDIIFIDLVMPKVDGRTLCRIIRNMPHLKRCFLVVVSAAAAEIGEDYKDFGADACIAKGSFDQMAKHVLAVLELSGKKNETFLPILGAENIRPRQMTRELLSRTRHLESVIDSISDGIIEIYSDRIVAANPAALFMFNQSFETLIGTSFPKLFHESEQDQIKRLMVDAHIPPPGTVDIVITSGHEKRQVVIRKLPMDTEADTHLFLITDVTELKKADENIRRTRQKLEQEVARRVQAEEERLKLTEKLQRARKRRPA